MKLKIKQQLKFDIPCCFLIVALFAAGLFYEFAACAASVFLSGYLFAIVIKNREVVFKLNLTSAFVVVAAVLYLLSAFWAVDSGMSFIGFLKFLPLPLFMLVMMQKSESKSRCINALPPTMAVMTVISAIIMLFSPRNEFFAPAGRLAGFLQYSNTFALLLLVSVIVIATKEKISKLDYAILAILIVGIMLSGSRTTFVLTILSAVVITVRAKNKWVRIFVIVAVGAAAAASAIYALATNNFAAIGRFLSTSLSESTFVGRLLYYYDALPIVLKNPFGTGYLGFYYLQQSVQTGLYSVRSVHNDFLQLALDIGWVPLLMLLAAVVRVFFKKKTPLSKRLIIFVMTAHCFFDIDLQFIAVFMVYILFIGFDDGKEFRLKNSLGIFKATFPITLTISAYMAVSLGAAVLGSVSLANTLYPWNTDVNTVMLANETDAEKMNERADKILAQNEYVTLAYSAKSAYYYTNGDFANMIAYKERAINNSPLVGEEYEDYIKMLLIGEELYIQAGDASSAEFCHKKIVNVIGRFNRIEENLSELGKKIDDKPKTEFSSDIAEYLSERGYM